MIVDTRVKFTGYPVSMYFVEVKRQVRFWRFRFSWWERANEFISMFDAEAALEKAKKFEEHVRCHQLGRDRIL